MRYLSRLIFFLCYAFFPFPPILAQTEPSTKVIEVPAEYQTVTKKVLVKKGGFSDWVEVGCETKVQRPSIQKVQIALRDLGYDVDTTSSVYDVDTLTKKALVKFQKDYGAPLDNLDPLRFLFEQHEKFLEEQKY